MNHNNWFIYAEDAGKRKNVQELDNFSEEQQAVWLFRTNYHNTEKQPWIIQETTQIIKIQEYVNFWTGSFFMNSVIILSHIYIYIYKHLLCEINYSGEC